jgi:hypothetical protein
LRFEVISQPNANLHGFKVNYTLFNANYPWNWQRTPPAPEGTIYRNPIEDAYARFQEWLANEVKPYIDEMLQPDLWAGIEQQREFVTPTSLTPHDVSFFTDEEKPSLRTSIKQFRLLVCEKFDPTQEQLEIIDERLDYLSEAVDRLNRFDWKSLGLGTVLSIVVALSLDTSKGKLLFDLFKQAFSGMLHLLTGG